MAVAERSVSCICEILDLEVWSVLKLLQRRRIEGSFAGPGERDAFCFPVLFSRREAVMARQKTVKAELQSQIGCTAGVGRRKAVYAA